jgi:hypothetical protein
MLQTASYIFDYENGEFLSLRNVSELLPDHMAPQPRTQHVPYPYLLEIQTADL